SASFPHYYYYLSKKQNQIMKRLNYLWVMLLPVFAFFYACESRTHVDATVTREVNTDSVRLQISALEAAYADASNKKDPTGVAAYYATDAESYPPGEPSLVGKDAIQAGLKRHMDMDTSGTTMSLNTTGVWASGNYATETGTWTDKDSTGKVVATGKYMTLFELRDGKYVAIRDIWNTETSMAKDTTSN
ncbi:MAG TPA: nuclear transport factor 2 family protein, partial [Saprospiraceae bacterium]|nr:nuclear transport factor 2 family protein [Saprospiraceae bacterium]